MTQTYTLLLFLLLAGAAQAQAPAVRPPAPVPRPPVHTPGYAPGTPPEPVYAPAGAGASHGGLVAPARAVERSPNRRVLPATGEPGVWAADGDPALMASASGPKIADVPLPVPHVVDDATVVLVPEMCAEMVNDALRGTRHMVDVLRMKLAPRRCLVAKLYAMCAEVHVILAGEDDEDADEPDHVVSPKAAADVLRDAQQLREVSCRGVSMPPAAEGIFDAVKHHRQFKSAW